MKSWLSSGDSIARRHAKQCFHFLAVGHASAQDALVVLHHDARGSLHVLGSSFDFKVAVFQLCGDVQSGFEEFQIFVEGAEEFVDTPSHSDGLFHQVLAASILRLG